MHILGGVLLVGVEKWDGAHNYNVTQYPFDPFCFWFEIPTRWQET